MAMTTHPAPAGPSARTIHNKGRRIRWPKRSTNMKLRHITLLCWLCFGISNGWAEGNGEQTRPLSLTLTYGGLPDPNYLLATFKNESTSNIRILRPIGGSEWPVFSIEPSYELSISDVSGVALPIKGHCKVVGPFTDTRWPDDYVVMLSPGESIAIKVYITATVPEDGAYSVRLKYRFTGKAKYPLPTMKADLSGRAIWNGEVESAVTQLKLKKTTSTDLGTREVEQVEDGLNSKAR